MPDEQPTSSSATVWPPPPDSARYAFTVEDVDVARIGDRLTLTCHKIRRTSAWMTPVATAIGVVEAVVVRSTYLGISLSLPLTPYGRFVAILVATAPFVVLNVMASFTWRFMTRRRDDGVFTLYRDTRTGTGYCEPLGEMSSVLRIRTTNRHWIGQPRYVLNLHFRGGLARTTGPLPPNLKNLLFIPLRFRYRENAERLAREIADVTGVELLSDKWRA